MPMLCSRLVPLILFIFLPSRIPAQKPQPAGGTTRGLVIDHPERLSGSWEVKGDHAIYGLHIQLATRVDGAPVTLIGVQQIFHSASIEVMNAQVPRGGLATGTGFQMNRPSYCGPTGTLYSNRRRPELVWKYNLISSLIPFLTGGRDVFAVAPLIARSLFFALIRKLPLPKAPS
jgi:hypothetical protein